MPDVNKIRLLTNKHTFFYLNKQDCARLRTHTNIIKRKNNMKLTFIVLKKAAPKGFGTFIHVEGPLFRSVVVDDLDGDNGGGDNVRDDRANATVNSCIICSLNEEHTADQRDLGDWALKAHSQRNTLGIKTKYTVIREI